MLHSTDLSKFSNPEYSHGASLVKRVLWQMMSSCFIYTHWPIPGLVKRFILKVFGAKLGRGVVLKTKINIKHPWMLTVDDHTWIGESVWIDNLVPISIGKHVCLSQGSMLLTGNHNYKRSSFDLITGSIRIENGAWIGAKAIVGPGVHVGTHAVLSVASVATKDCEAYGIYRGNPAQWVKKRNIEA